MIPELLKLRSFCLVLMCLALSACSPPADQAETTWQERSSEVSEEQADEPAPPGDGRPLMSEFSEQDISAIRQFPDESFRNLAETSAACRLLSPDELGDVFGGEWTEGSFIWIENELQIAPAALEGICVWQQLELRTSVTLRVYAASDLAWASLLQHDDGFARRFYERQLADGPSLGNDAYRKPMGTDGYDSSCVLLDQHIACLSASARHAEQWTEDDQALLELIAERLSDTSQ